MGVAGRLAANEAQQAGIANFVAGVQPWSMQHSHKWTGALPQPDTVAQQPLPWLRPLPYTCSLFWA